MSAQSVGHKKEVIKYYVGTRQEYRILWRSNHSFGIHFGYYDKENTSHDAAVSNINKKLAVLADVASKDSILDAGCGIGGSAIWLAENYGCRVTGVNIVPWQIERAKSLTRKRKLTSLLNFRLADYADTRLEKESFSVVWGLESIVHAENKQAVINEAFRVLSPGGRLVISEYLLTDDGISEVNKATINQWLRGWAMPSLLTEKQYGALMVNAGFKDISVNDWTKHVEPSFARLKKFINILNPVAPLLYRLHIVNKSQIDNLHASDAQMKALTDGLWRYKVILAHKPKKGGSSSI